MEKNIKVLKQELKQFALELHNDKADLKKTQRETGYAGNLQFSLHVKKREYRHKHISYSMMRGRTYEQIEQKCAENNKPDMALIQRILDEYNTKNVCISKT